ncbi:MAG: zinc-dependent alcohol dehydrogenase family protein [Candidatus Aminicenantes bacterium]|nr:MAG: zinc-dependent alcohol dehydrogenase family protein [Candidatus Aminicenantes bacterium]
MRAMMLKELAPIDSNPLELVDIPIPEPGPEEILIRNKVCGVCHTDLHTVEGELPQVKLPIIPGHEVIGIVEKRGEIASRFKEGDRVGVAWLNSACGECEFCLRGYENLCVNARFTGYSVNGGFADYMVVPEKFAYIIPERLYDDSEAAPLLCGGIVGYRALRFSEIKPGQRLGLYGFGASAHIAIQVALFWECEVYVFSRSEAHRALARKLGASWTGTSKDNPQTKLHSSIIFAPAGELVLDALAVLEKGGTVALAGIYMSPIPEMDYVKYLYQERTLRSVANATRQDGEELLRIAAEIPIRTVTQVFTLEEANNVLHLLKAGKVNGAAVLQISGTKDLER